MPPTTHDTTPVVRKCFVISPIGADGSPVREHADNVFEFIIKPAITECGLSAHRADHLQEPGKITEQMIRDITTSDCCVAVLTGHNPNVFYELAVAHAVGTPVVTLIEKSEPVPFDVMDQRCIRYDFNPTRLFQGVYRKEVVAHLTKLAEAGWERRPLFGPPAGKPILGQLSATLVGELSADWVMKRDRLSAGQRRLLKGIELATERADGTVRADDLLAAFSGEKYNPSEFHYRLEALRLLGFVELAVSPATNTPGEPVAYCYALSAGYRTVPKDDAYRPVKSGQLVLRPGPPVAAPGPAQQAALAVPPSADICPVNRSTHSYRSGEPFALTMCGLTFQAADNGLTVNGRDYGQLADGDELTVFADGTWTVNGQPRMPE